MLKKSKKTKMVFLAEYKIECAVPDKFLTELTLMGIELNYAEKTDEIHLSFETDYINYKKIKAIKELPLKAKIINIKKNGALSLVPRLKKRLYFIFGFLLCLCILLFATGHIWTLEVTGNKMLEDDFIISALKDEGFYEGVSKSGINVRNIQNQILMKHKELSWIWIYIKGTHAVCEIRESTPIPEVENPKTYNNVVASYDGIIMDVMPNKGRQAVEIGDAVKAGDLLIGGISETVYDDIRFINASGKVLALTHHTAEGEYSHKKELRYLTGEKSKNITLNFFGKQFKIKKGSENKYKDFDFTEKIHKNTFFDKISLPISFTIGEYCEIIKEYEQISDEEVINTAKQRLYADVKRALPKNTKILGKFSEHNKNEKGNIYVKLTVVCKEDIAVQKQIITPELTEEN